MTGKTVLITGASSGIGCATAKLFAMRGVKELILCGRREHLLRALESQLKDKTKITLLCFDIRDSQAVQAAMDQLNVMDKHVDILINNAGLAKGLDFIHEGNLDHWETMIDTNVKGLLYISRLISADMVERNEGHIINVCSTAGKEVYPKGNVYCATKFAVDALTKAMRQDLYKYNIRVGQVAPGHVEQTEFAINRFDGDQERANIYSDFTPLNAQDVAETIHFIASRPAHVNIQDVLLMSTQQGSATLVDRSGRK